MARTHVNEEAHRRFAEAKGVSLRTAQRHSGKPSKEWIEFIQADHHKLIVGDEKKIPRLPAKSDLPPAPPSVNKERSAMTPEEWAEVEVYNLFRHYSNLAQTTESALDSSAYARHTAELFPKWLQARGARQKAEERARKVVPIGEFYTFKSIVARVAGLVQSIPELAHRLNPASPGLARDVLLAWQQQTFNPAVEAVARECDDKIISSSPIEHKMWSDYGESQKPLIVKTIGHRDRSSLEIIQNQEIGGLS